MTTFRSAICDPATGSVSAGWPLKLGAAVDSYSPRPPEVLMNPPYSVFVPKGEATSAVQMLPGFGGATSALTSHSAALSATVQIFPVGREIASAGPADLRHVEHRDVVRQ